MRSQSGPQNQPYPEVVAASVDPGAACVEAGADREICEVVPTVRSAHEQDLVAKQPVRASMREIGISQTQKKKLLKPQHDYATGVRGRVLATCKALQAHLT